MSIDTTQAIVLKTHFLDFAILTLFALQICCAAVETITQMSLLAPDFEILLIGYIIITSGFIGLEAKTEPSTVSSIILTILIFTFGFQMCLAMLVLYQFGQFFPLGIGFMQACVVSVFWYVKL